MNCQEEKMTQEMRNAMPEGCTVDYHHSHDFMNVTPTLKYADGSGCLKWDEEVKQWYYYKVMNMKEIWAIGILHPLVPEIFRMEKVYV